MSSWESVDVTDWTVVDDEPMGTKDKRWLEDPDGQRWLFKSCRVKNEVVRGEDWAEWITWRLAGMLGVPAAQVRPARLSGHHGVLSLSMVERDERLVAGNELLARGDGTYDESVSRSNPRYTLSAVHGALDGMPGLSFVARPTSFSAFDVWASYVLLDAWVAGRDRHHENWGAIEAPDGSLRLAPSFDHGNGLGFQESPARHAALSADPEALRRWAERGRSHHFAGRPSLVEVAHGALRMAHPDAERHWLDALADVDQDQVRDEIRQVSADVLSETSAMFCHRLLTVNRRRLLDVR
ncbi:hypothetical protein ABLG96_00940 [Nakamurella sp. A5-74]|uniref:HipA-like C-terminal domain-containing protein n=1 Tax=Nakamurella sp. A5-74 TaxID=3158264 RepID=A0AAU8DRH3_9ACTN